MLENSGKLRGDDREMQEMQEMHEHVAEVRSNQRFDPADSSVIIKGPL